MQEHDTFPGKQYVVTCKTGCSITDSSGHLDETCDPGKQKIIIAPSDKLYTSERASVRETFKSAPAKLMALGLLGGGVQTLPAGYLAAEFLESTGVQYINTNYIPSNDDGLLTDVETLVEGDRLFMGSRNGANTETRFYAFRYSNFASKGFGWGNWNVFLNAPSFSGRMTTKVNFLNSRLAESDYLTRDLSPLSFSPEYPMFIFAVNIGGVPGLVWGGRIWRAQISNKADIAMDFLPAVDKNGSPCMYDLISKKPFYNIGSGSFIVGLTLAQARKLGKLPSTGGRLTISLPSNWQEDEGVVNALATAEANGWVLTYQTYESDASTASTFALRRIFVRKTQDENGQYIDADGTRWHVEWCAGMIGAEPTDHGYEPFRSVDSAVAYWELEPWVDPEAEELLTNSTTND